MTAYSDGGCCMNVGVVAVAPLPTVVIRLAVEIPRVGEMSWTAMGTVVGDMEGE